MKHIFTFDLRRFGLLLRNEIMKNRKRALMAAGGVSAIILALFVLATLGGSTDIFFEPWYYPLLFIGGYFLSSTAFNDIHEKDRSYEFYLLPASIPEKFASRALLYALIYPLALAVLLFLTSLGGNFLHLLLQGRGTEIFNPLRNHVLIVTGIYFITQSIFLYGSIAFKKHAFFKVGLITSLIQLLLIPIIIVMLRIIFNDIGQDFPHNYDFGRFAGDPGFILDFLGNWFQLIKFLFIYVTAPFFWFVSLLKLGESEV